MTTIQSITINADATSVTIVASALPNEVTSIRAWTSSTFKSPAQAINLSPLLVGIDQSAGLTIEIPASELGVSRIEGVHYFELISDALPIDSDVVLGLAANLIPYNECLLRKVLAIQSYDKCKPSVDTCEECASDLELLASYLVALDYAILQQYYEEVALLEERIKCLCKDCQHCNSYSVTQLVSGYGYGTIDNAIALI